MENRLERQKARQIEREKTDKRLTIIAILLLLFAISIGSIYGYWAGTIANPNEKQEIANEMTIGQGEDVTTVLDVQKTLAAEGKKLVPKDKAALSKGGTAENVEELTTTYKVFWKEEDKANKVIKAEDLVNGTLNINAVGKIDGKVNDLLVVEVTPNTTDITAEGEGKDVTVKVTLKEPENKAQYDEIINKPITVDLSFSVNQ